MTESNRGAGFFALRAEVAEGASVSLKRGVSRSVVGAVFDATGFGAGLLAGFGAGVGVGVGVETGLPTLGAVTGFEVGLEGVAGRTLDFCDGVIDADAKRDASGSRGLGGRVLPRFT